MNSLNSFFEVSKRKTNYSREIISGIIVFISMFYIIPVQGTMMSVTGINPATIGIVTAITAGLASIFMGVYAKYPVALASGMGINAFIAYTLILGGMSYSSAMAAVMISGIIFVVVSITPARMRIINAIPDDIKKAISIGIGLFIMFVALSNTGIITSDGGTITSLGNLKDPVVLLSFIGIFITIILWMYNVKGGVLIAMIVTIIIGFSFRGISDSTNWISSNPSALPDWNINWSGYADSFKDLDTVVGQSFIGFSNVDNTWANPTWYLAIFVLFLNDFFDTSGTLFGINSIIEKDVKLEGKMKDRVFSVDALSTTFASMLGATNVTSYVESTAGVQYGGRTGISAITAGMLFILSIPIIPLLTPLFTSAVTAGAIVMVGIIMASLLKEINVDDKVYLVSSVFTIIFMVLGFSIGTGIVIGLITFILLMLVSGRYKELDWILIASSPGLMAFLILPLFI
ncbi:MAG: NCS2 family permease [Mycoplasmataceae bacterium]|nr:NCS2 family permease [Mycoplasmataceae bacterium]